MVVSRLRRRALWVGAGRDPDDPVQWAWSRLATVAGSTVVWVTATFLTPPEPEAALRRFYLRVRPGGRGWTPISASLGLAMEPVDGGRLNWTNWVAGWSWCIRLCSAWGSGSSVSGCWPRAS